LIDFALKRKGHQACRGCLQGERTASQYCKTRLVPPQDRNRHQVKNALKILLSDHGHSFGHDRRLLFASAQGWLIMPTDLRVASERRRKATQGQVQTEVTILSVFVIIALLLLLLLALDQSFSKAAIEMYGRF
jgi:hypothetical protein